jgi:hypothetical protein
MAPLRRWFYIRNGMVAFGSVERVAGAGQQDDEVGRARHVESSRVSRISWKTRVDRESDRPTEKTPGL